MHKFLYEYLKQKYGEKTKLYYMSTYNFIFYTTTEHSYLDNTKYVVKISDTLNYELDRLLPNVKNSKSNWLMKDHNRVRSTENKCI